MSGQHPYGGVAQPAVVAHHALVLHQGGKGPGLRAGARCSWTPVGVECAELSWPLARAACTVYWFASGVEVVGVQQSRPLCASTASSHLHRCCVRGGEGTCLQTVAQLTGMPVR